MTGDIPNREGIIDLIGNSLIMKTDIPVLLVLLVIGAMTAGCSSADTAPQTTVPTPRNSEVTATNMPAAVALAPVATATAELDPVMNRTWMYAYKVEEGSYVREASMAFTMNEGGKTDGTITSRSGFYASITGEWYKDPATGRYYVTPILCMSLKTQQGEVVGPAGETVKWDGEAPDIPGRNNPFHWCKDTGVTYEMKYMPPKKLVEMGVSNTRTAISGVTFTTD